MSSAEMTLKGRCLMLQNFSIEPVSPADCAAIASIEELCFSHPWSSRAVSDTLSQDNTVFLKAVSGGELIGYISFQYVLDEGYINNIAVHPRFRQSGVGKRLLQAALEQGRKLRLSFLTLEVRPSNIPAVHLYTTSGFSSVGQRKNFYQDPTEDALLLTYTFKN